MFHVGQTVECIDSPPDWWRLENPRPIYPELGNKFIILDIAFGRTKIGLILDGLPTPNKFGWDARNFRPIVERKTDISVFTEMLKHKEMIE